MAGPLNGGTGLVVRLIRRKREWNVFNILWDIKLVEFEFIWNGSVYGSLRRYYVCYIKINVKSKNK